MYGGGVGGGVLVCIYCYFEWSLWIYFRISLYKSTKQIKKTQMLKQVQNDALEGVYMLR